MEIINWTSGLDWLTLSKPASTLPGQGFAEFYRIINAQLRGGEDEAKSIVRRGYRGCQIGAVAFGHREYDGHQLIEASGPQAEWLGRQAIRHGIFARCTRADVQITWRLSKSNPDYVDQIRSAVRQARSEKRCKSRLANCLHETSDGISGLSIGPRTSSICGRVYEYNRKHSDTTNWDLYRGEIELKKEPAQELWDLWREHDFPEILCAEVAATRMQKWGIFHPEFADLGKRTMSGTREVTNLEKRLAYTQRVIVPFLARLIEDGQADALTTMFEANGLIEVGKDRETSLLWKKPELDKGETA